MLLPVLVVTHNRPVLVLEELVAFLKSLVTFPGIPRTMFLPAFAKRVMVVSTVNRWTICKGCVKAHPSSRPDCGFCPKYKVSFWSRQIEVKERLTVSGVLWPWQLPYVQRVTLTYNHALHTYEMCPRAVSATREKDGERRRQSAVNSKRQLYR